MPKIMHMVAEHIKEVEIQTLRSEFKGLLMHKTDTSDDFAMKLTTTINKICKLGDKVDEA